MKTLFIISIITFFVNHHSTACLNFKSLTEVDSSLILKSNKLVEEGDKSFYMNHNLSAKVYYTEAVKYDSLNIKAYVGLARVRSEAGDYKNAVILYTKAIILDSLNDVFFVERGFYNWSAKNFSAAYKDFSKAIELNPMNSEAYFHRGLLNHKLLKFDECCEDMYKSQELGGDVQQEEINRFCKTK